MTACCPGDRLASVGEATSGSGTYVKDGFIYASLLGVQQARSAPGEVPRLEVAPKQVQPPVPEPGSIVTAKVTRVLPTAAHLRILCVGDKALESDFAGVIRQRDVRITEIDSVVMYSCFRPGDIVRCEVLSLGDARSYHLTTARNELGVVYATSSAGVPMVPVSWQQMQCPETGEVQPRKVAKVAMPLASA